MSVVWQQYLVSISAQLCASQDTPPGCLRSGTCRSQTWVHFSTTLHYAGCCLRSILYHSCGNLKSTDQDFPLLLCQLNPFMPTPQVPHRGNHPNKQHLLWACWLESFILRKLQDKQQPKTDNADQAQSKLKPSSIISTLTWA